MSEVLPIKMMVDSGAYTVWQSGREIDIDAYCDFLLANAGDIWVSVALDVIPGKVGAAYSWTAYEDAAARSFANYIHMRKRGLDPIPVCHQGESLHWIPRYLDAGATYIGLSRRPGFNRKAQRKWLDDAFVLHLTDRAGNLLVKVHGFGITSAEFVSRYPWYSYDSAAWAKQAAAGKILVPPFTLDGDAYDFLARPTPVVISGQRPRLKKPAYLFEEMTRREQEHVRRYISHHVDDMCGLTFEDVQDWAYARQAFNILFFQRQAAAIGGEHPKFVIASSPSSRIAALTPVHRHQIYHLLSYAHLT